MKASTRNKLLIGAVALVALVLIAALTGRKSAHSEVFIPASPATVWQVLVDLASYPEWNPVIDPMEGELKEGGKLAFNFIQEPGNAYRIDAEVRAVVEDTHLNQFGGMIGILTFDHHYRLDPAQGGTRVTIHEDYRGIGVHFWSPDAVEAAYDRLNAALRDRVLAIASGKN